MICNTNAVSCLGKEIDLTDDNDFKLLPQVILKQILNISKQSYATDMQLKSFQTTFDYINLYFNYMGTQKAIRSTEKL